MNGHSIGQAYTIHACTFPFRPTGIEALFSPIGNRSPAKVLKCKHLHMAISELSSAVSQPGFRNYMVPKIFGYPIFHERPEYNQIKTIKK